MRSVCCVCVGERKEREEKEREILFSLLCLYNVLVLIITVDSHADSVREMSR